MPAGRLSHIGPLSRLLTAIVLAIRFATLTSLTASLLAAAMGGALAIAMRLPTRLLQRRLISLNLLLGLLVVLLPFTWHGPTDSELLGLGWSRQGLHAALLIILKANGIVLTFMALLTTIGPERLGAALQQLRLSPKLVLMFVLCLRYIEVIRMEYQRLRVSMRLRAFHPRLDCHTLHTYGNLIGMLLVRSHIRSERVLQAMRCRGFNGKFPTALTTPWSRIDSFVLTSACLLVIFISIVH